MHLTEVFLAHSLLALYK